MAEVVIGRWGKNLAIRLPAHVAKKAGLGDGERVEIISSDKEVIVRKLPAKLTVEVDVFRRAFRRLARALRGCL